jgi:hypothetical protein
MVNFFKHLSSRTKALIAAHERDVAEYRAMSNAELVESAEYCLKNCEFPHRWQPGEPVYDGAMAHVVIPELLRRLKVSP